MNRILSFFLEFIGFLVILAIFLVISLQYYQHTLKDNIPGDTQVGKIISNGFAVYDRYIGISKKATANYSDIFYVNQTELQNEISQLTISPSPTEIGSSVVILNYHGVVPDSEVIDKDYKINFSTFKQHMFALKEEGFQTVSLQDFYDFLQSNKQLPKKSMVITFDDGIKSTFYYTDPLLKNLNYTAVMFVITSHSVDDPHPSKYYLNLSELMEMHSNGRWDIQAHTYAGHNLITTTPEGKQAPFYGNKLWNFTANRPETDEEYANRISTDVSRARADIETTFNKTVLGLSLPFGNFAQRDSNYENARKVLLDSIQENFKMVFYQFKPAIEKDFSANYNDKKQDFYLVMRISTDDLTTNQLMSRLHAAEAIDYLPYVETFDNVNRWIRVSGDLNTTNQRVSIEARNGNVIGNVSLIYLDGSYLWKNYSFNATIESSGAEKVSLLGRFQDSQDYVSCKFSPTEISIISLSNGTKIEEFDQYLLSNLTRANVSLSAEGNTISCSINGNTLTKNITSANLYGGVGFRAESFYPGTPVVLSNITITGLTGGGI